MSGQAKSPPPIVLPAPNPRTLFLGVSIAAAIAVCALGLRGLIGIPALSPLILSILLGMLFQNTVGVPPAARPGVAFSVRRILRFGVVLLGFQLTIQQILDIGITGLLIVAATVVSSFMFATWVGAKLGVNKKLTQLIAAGTSICGASAVIAANAVVEASDEDTAYAVACVTVFGTVLMLLYPILPGPLHLAPKAFGLWAGASIHEVAQVVAASYQDGKAAGDYGTITKLTRVVFLAPMVIVLSSFASKHDNQSNTGRRIQPPYFILGFLLAAVANSVLPASATFKDAIVVTTNFLLSIALAALGLETHLSRVRANGARPLVLSGIATLFISIVSLALIIAASS